MADPDIRKSNTLGGAVVLFGLPFLLLGLTFVFFYFHTPEGWTTSGDTRVAAAVGGLFSVIGALLVIARAGITLDRRRGLITKWWGLLVPLGRKEYRIDRVRAITISRAIHQTKNGSYTSYPVSIEGDGVLVEWDDGQDYAAMRRAAEDVAKFLKLGIRDRSSGTEVVRDAGTLDESLPARARRLGTVTPMPAQPPGAVCAIRHGGPRGTSVIEIPPAGVNAVHWAGLIGALAFSAFVGYQMGFWSSGANGPDWVFFAFFGVFFFAFPVGAALLGLLNAAKSWQRLMLSAAGVRVEMHGPFRTKVVDLRSAEIEEVECTVPRKPAAVLKYSDQSDNAEGNVVIRSDRISCELGASLLRGEKEWLRDAIVHILTAEVSGAAAQPAAAPPRVEAAAAPIPAVRPAASMSAYAASPGAVGRNTGPNVFAVSLAGLAALVFVLFQTGMLKNFFPTQFDAPAPVAPAPTPATTAASQKTARAAPVQQDAKTAQDETAMQQALALAEKVHGPDHPTVAAVLYQMGAGYQRGRQPKRQEQAWLRALSILEKFPGTLPKKYLSEGFDGSIDKEMLARGIGDFYWDQYKYPESYKYYDLAYRYADEVQLDDAERNRRLASDSAGIMASACVLKKWEIADYAMQELKERIKTVSPDEQKRLQYWVRTGEPRLKNRKC